MAVRDTGRLRALAHHPRRFPTRSEIAARVKLARESVSPKMTRKDLAARANVPVWAYYKKEKGKAPFTTDELSRIADALNAPYLWPMVTWREGFLLERMPTRDPAKS